MRAEGFAAIPNWMVRDQSISLHAVMVYTALASHTGPGGVRPSQALLAKEARCSERQVRYALDELRALEVVSVVRRRRGEGKSTTLSNGYVLHPHGRLADDEEPEEVPASPAASSGKLPAHSDKATGTEQQLTPLIEEEPIKKNVANVATLSKGSRISPEWQPSPELVAWAVIHAPSVAALRESDNFVDYWLAAPGAKGIKRDWNATWRTWMRRAHDRNVDRGWKSDELANVGREEWMLR